MKIKVRYLSKTFQLLLIFICINSCKKEKSKSDLIVDESIEAHGGKNYENLNIRFNFRDKTYDVLKKGENFQYERKSFDKATSNEIIDIYTNRGLERFISGKKVVLADTMATKYKNSINSVVYFTLLPKPLNDAAVIKTYLGIGTIGGQKYHKIKVSFKAENGGKDHEDQYIYWFNTITKYMDYFAYSYKVDGGGIRFRECINAKILGGVRFQNYINYEPNDSSFSLENSDKAFITGKLHEISRIENEKLIQR